MSNTALFSHKPSELNKTSWHLVLTHSLGDLLFQKDLCRIVKLWPRFLKILHSVILENKIPSNMFLISLYLFNLFKMVISMLGCTWVQSHGFRSPGLQNNLKNVYFEAGVYLWLHVCGRKRSTLCIFFIMPTLFFETGSPTKPRVYLLVDCLAILFSSPTLGTGMCHHAHILCRCWASKFEFCVYMASIFTNQTISQPL